MNRRVIVLGMMLFSGVAAAMNDDDTDTMPREESALKEVGLKVDLAALNNGGELRTSPVRSFSMPSPRPGSPRSGNTSPRVSRFLGQHASPQVDKAGEGSHNAIQKLIYCETRLIALQGGSADRQTQIRALTDDVRKLADKCVEIERVHADDQRLISEAIASLKEAMKFLQLTTPQVKKVNSQPLRVSATRIAFAQLVAAPAVTSSGAVVAANEKNENADDETLCPSDDERATTEETE